MSFVSLNFCLFITGLLIIFWVCPQRFRWIILLAASLFFYWTIGKLTILHSVAISLIAWLSAKALGHNNTDSKAIKANKEIPSEEIKTMRAEIQKKNRLIMWSSVLLIIISWVFFKFYNPIAETFGSDSIMRIVVPVGMSFYSLSVLSYIIDVYNSTIEPEKNFFRLLLFTSFFPAILQGPIYRYNTVGKQLRCEKSFDYSMFVIGFERLLYGYFKKMIIADRISAATTFLYANYSEYSGFAVALAAFLFKIQLYTDFSGGIDITIGISQMLGISLPENFTLPFLSTTVSEYWRRWHITLGAWLKDYVFYPLTLTKPFVNLGKKLRKKNKNAARLVPALISMSVLWVCSAFWHGNHTNYIIWGLYFYILVAIDTLTEKKIEAFASKLSTPVKSLFTIGRIILTFILVVFGELVSDAKNFKDVFVLISHLFSRWDLSVITSGALFTSGADRADFTVLIIAVAALFVFEALLELKVIKDPARRLYEAPLPLRWVILFVGIFIILTFGFYGPGYDPAPFIYFQF